VRRAGFDAVTYELRDTSVSADLEGDADDGAPGEGDRIADDVEDLLGGNGPDTLRGNSASNFLIGGPGADVIDGGPGQDTLDGGDGPDDLRSRDGHADDVDCGPASDLVRPDALDALTACESRDDQQPTPRPGPPSAVATAADRAAPVAALRFPKQRLRTALTRGLRVSVTCSEPCRLRAVLSVDTRTAKRLGLRSRTLGRAAAPASRAATLVLKPSAAARRRLLKQRSLTLRVTLTVTDAAGNARVLNRTVKLH
jgi:hypothetical protein